jgi:glutathione S-transferase
MIIFYGSPRSSATRSRWLLEELGVPYEYRRVDTSKPRPERGADLLAVSPMAKVPALVDGDVRIIESAAINLYLAEKYAAGTLGPRDERERAEMMQWSVWGFANVMPLLIAVLYHTALLPEAERRAEEVKNNREWSAQYLSILEPLLAKGEWLVGRRFSCADVTLGSIVDMADGLGVELTPAVKGWLERLRARPAYRRASAD